MVCPYLFPLSCLCLPCCVSCFFLSWFGGLVVCQFVGCVGGLVVCRFAGLLFWWCGGLLVCWGSPCPTPWGGGSRLAMRKTRQAKKSPQNSRAATNTFPPVCWIDGLLFWWFACLLVCWFAGVVVCWSWWFVGLLVWWFGGFQGREGRLTFSSCQERK